MRGYRDTRLGRSTRTNQPPGLASLGGARGVAPYLGQVATRTQLPNDYNTTFKYKQNRRAHIARQDITSLQAVFANFFVNFNTAGHTAGLEYGSGAASSVTASIEYPAGTFTQVKFSGSATGTIPDAGFLAADATAVSIPKGAVFWVNQWENNTSGIVYTTYSVDPKLASNDYFQYSATALTDQTMSGISTNTGTGGTSSSGCVALIANTVLPSVYLAGDSRCQGVQDIPDAALDVGEIARSIGPYFAYINGGINGNYASIFLSSHTNQLALSQYCSRIVVEHGVNDMFVGGQTSAQVITSRTSIAALFAGKPCFQTTVMDETGSSDGWTSATQTQTNGAANTQRIAFNAAIRAGTGPTGYAGYFDITSVLETALNSGLWNYPGYTPDGVHEAALANIAILNSGIIDPTVFGPVSYSAAANALFARMTTPPTTPRKGLINNLIVSLQAAGVWSKLDALYLLAAADSQAALLNWTQNLYNATEINSPTFTANTGYAGDGSTSYLDTGFIPSSATAPQYALNSASVFVRSNTNHRGNNEAMIGSTTIQLNPWNGTVNFATNHINGTAGGFVDTPTTSKGLFTLTRATNAAITLYQDASSLGAITEASTAVPTVSTKILGNISTQFTARQASVAGFGSTLSAGDVSNLSAAISAYLTALGVS